MRTLTCRFYLRGIIHNVADSIRSATPAQLAWTAAAPPKSLDHALSLLHQSGFLKRRDFSGETIAALSALPMDGVLAVLVRFQQECMRQNVPSKWYGPMPSYRSGSVSLLFYRSGIIF